MRSVESAECRKCGVCFISLMSVKNEACVIWKVALIL